MCVECLWGGVCGRKRSVCVCVGGVCVWGVYKFLVYSHSCLVVV